MPRLVARVALGDFGESTAVRGTPLANNVGTVEFMAPEVFAPKAGSSIYDESCDIWSFGMVNSSSLSCERAAFAVSHSCSRFSNLVDF
jgi:serine/threonine protein kinase